MYQVLISFAKLFNAKAKLFSEGRQGIFENIKDKIHPYDKPIWFHFASLGEFEQGRPVLEAIKNHYPLKKILITFFSPSGFEAQKNYPLADYIFYLPIDTRTNAQKFIEIVQPSLVIFTKYEYWYHYFKTLKQNNTPLIVVSAIFREDQVFFKWYGSIYREMLSCVTQFFVQNTNSAALLQSLGFTNITISGDTRFDRVAVIKNNAPDVPYIKAFVNGQKCIVAGSTWPADEAIIISYFKGNNNHLKLIIAPHEVGQRHLSDIRAALNSINIKAINYSEITERTDLERYNVLVIDSIGLLNKLYAYANIAYIGGGFGSGIHNTLEAAVWHIPVIIGPKYQKFQEAIDLLALNVAYKINSFADFEALMKKIMTNDDITLIATGNAQRYFENSIGATDRIYDYIYSSNFIN